MGFLDTVKGWFGIEPPKSPEELALLAAIRAQPDDMPARLAYAEYLEAQQQPFGRYLRCEVEKLALPPDDPRGDELTAEADQLMERHGKRWVRPFKEMELEPVVIGMHLPSLWFARGMIEEVIVDKRAVVPGKFERLVELAPALRKLIFARCSPDWAAIAAAPQLTRIKALDLSDVKPALSDLKLLSTSPNLAQLEELDLGGRELGPELAALLAQSPRWKQLRVLSLSSCRLDVEGARLLASTANLAGLQELNLSYNSIGDAGVAALVASPHLKNLRRLNLASNDLTFAAAETLRAAAWAPLEELEINSNKLGPAGLTALSQAPAFAKLRKLNLASNDGTDAGAIAWAKSASLASVRQLEIGHNELTDAGVAALANSPHVANLIELDLSISRLTNIDVLVNSPHLKRLRKLKLYSCDLDSAAKARLRAAFGDEAVEE
ncbi:MAG TPA: TIGR02996 domain-containing protein [Pirellulaceae bacterium]|nr:TIGR02996 domain-containing protein [Pirellulaceae bacterium]